MDFALNEEQELLRRSARDFLTANCPMSLVKNMSKDAKGYPLDLWRKMSALGWMGLPFAEEYAGYGASFLDLVVLLEEMGRASLPGPFFSTVVLGGLTVLEAGSESQKQSILPKISKGDMILTLALTELDGSYNPPVISVTATPKGDSFVLNGTKLFVPDIHIADRVICVARTPGSIGTEGITLFVVDPKSSGLSMNLLNILSGDKQFEVLFDNVPVHQQEVIGELGRGWYPLERVLQKGTIGQCAEMVGAMQRILEMTVSYAKERVQFEHPIGSFQAIQHHCANMLTDVEGSRFITYQAAWMLSEGIPATKEVSMAKSWANECCEEVIRLGHRVQGGVSLIDLHDMPAYTARAAGWGRTFGDTQFHRELIAQQLLGGQS